MSAVKTASQVKEHPILFSGEMVRAILEGRKTQTRRVIKPQFSQIWGRGCPNKQPFEIGDFYTAQRWKDAYAVNVDLQDSNGVWEWLFCPFGKVGDRLWVRETWEFVMGGAHHFGGQSSASYELRYVADNKVKELDYEGKSGADPYFKLADSADGKRPSIFMPRWASRLTLEITNIRVERLREITAQGCIAEGVKPYTESGIGWRMGFQKGWDKLNAKRGYSFDSNPFVWVIEFKKL